MAVRMRRFFLFAAYFLLPSIMEKIFNTILTKSPKIQQVRAIISRNIKINELKE
jgi:hypothetical protein